MRCQRLSYRYAMTVRSGQTWPVGNAWSSDRPRLLVQPWSRTCPYPAATTTTVGITVDLTGVDEDDFEVQLFADALVIEGHRRPPYPASVWSSRLAGAGQRLTRAQVAESQQRPEHQEQDAQS